jgi:hypothetical protein
MSEQMSTFLACMCWLPIVAALLGLAGYAEVMFINSFEISNRQYEIWETKPKDVALAKDLAHVLQDGKITFGESRWLVGRERHYTAERIRKASSTVQFHQTQNEN